MTTYQVLPWGGYRDMRRKRELGVSVQETLWGRLLRREFRENQDQRLL